MRDRTRSIHSAAALGKKESRQRIAVRRDQEVPRLRRK
jgi:hypothetical protein